MPPLLMRGRYGMGPAGGRPVEAAALGDVPRRAEGAAGGQRAHLARGFRPHPRQRPPLVERQAQAPFRAAGHPVLQEPATMPWGERQAYLSDPEGNPVALAMPI